MKKTLLTSILFMFAFLIAFTVFDTLKTYIKFSENKKVISNLDTQSLETADDISSLRQKIERVDTDRTYINNMITRKFKMLKKDQFIIHE